MQFHKRLDTALCFLGNMRPKEWDAETGKFSSTGMPTQLEDWDLGGNSLLALTGKICQSPRNWVRGNCFQPVLLPSNRTAQQVWGKQPESGPWNKCQATRACLSPLFTAALIFFPFFKCSTPNQTRWKKSSWIDACYCTSKSSPSEENHKVPTKSPSTAVLLYHILFHLITRQEQLLQMCFF